jgi:hypothetical protein
MPTNGSYQTDARAALTKYVQQHYSSVPENASVHELSKMARVWSDGDALIEGMIRNAELAEETAKHAPKKPALQPEPSLSHEEYVLRLASWATKQGFQTSDPEDDEEGGLRDFASHLDSWVRRGVTGTLACALAEHSYTMHQAMAGALAEYARTGQPAQETKATLEALKTALAEQTKRSDEMEAALWAKLLNEEKQHAEQMQKADGKIAALERENADMKREMLAVRYELNSAHDVDERFREVERSMAARQLAIEEQKRGPQGKVGPKGDRGLKGDPGRRGRDGKDAAEISVVSWQLDRERYRVSPLMSNGRVGPSLELRDLFEYFLHETGG